MSLSAKPYLQQVSIRQDAGIEFDHYPYDVPSVRGLGQLNFHPDVTFFVGENGSGKSTILEGIAVALGYGPEGGTKSVQLQTTEPVSSLHRDLRLARSFKKAADGYFLCAESFFNVATYMDEVGYLGGVRQSLAAFEVSRRSVYDAAHAQISRQGPLSPRRTGSRAFAESSTRGALGHSSIGAT